MELFAKLLVYLFCIVCAGLMARFIFGCWGQIMSAMTVQQLFTAVLRLLIGVLLFPITIMVQALDVTVG